MIVRLNAHGATGKHGVPQQSPRDPDIHPQLELGRARCLITQRVRSRCWPCISPRLKAWAWAWASPESDVP